MVEGFALGLAVFLGLTLVAAGLIKLVQLELTRRSLIRLLPSRRRPDRTVLTLAAVVLGSGELAFGATLAVVPTTPLIAAGAVLLCAGFVAVVTVAQRRGAACGCFGSFSVRTSGPVESARALALLGTSLVLFASAAVGDAVGDRAGQVSLVGVAAGLAAAAAAVGVAITAAGPHRSPRAAVVALVTGVSRYRSGAGWRSALPWERRRLIRTARADASVRDVEERAPSSFDWRWAKVRLTGRPVRVASVVVQGRGARLQILLPAAGPLAVVCYSASGVITPRRAETAGISAGVSGGPGPLAAPGRTPVPVPAPATGVS